MAYIVSDRYREVIYSGGAIHKPYLTIGGTLIPSSQISSISISSPLFDNAKDYFKLGQFVSQKVEITFRNTNDILPEGIVDIKIGTMVDGTEEIVPIGVYVIDSTIESFHETNKLTLMDYAVKLKSPIDISSIMPATMEQILQYICTQNGVTLGTYSTLNMSEIVNVYDSTISGKEYISMISELNASFPKIGRDGKLNLVPMAATSTVNINGMASKSLNIGDNYLISRVMYNDAIRLAEFGTEDNNTLQIDPSNIFVGDNYQTIIENIYNEVVGTSLYTITNENYGDPSLDAWDIITITTSKGNFNTFNNNLLTYQQNISTKIDTKIPNKLQEQTVNTVDDPNVKIRKVQTTVNQIEGKVNIVVQEQEDLNNQVSNLEVDLDGITGTVSELEIKQFNDVVELNNELDGKASNESVAEVFEMANAAIDSTNILFEFKESVEVDGVTILDSQTGIRFDKNGMTVDVENTPIKAQVTEYGVIVDNKETNVLESFNGYVTQELIETYPELTKYLDQSVNHNTNINYSEYLASKNFRTEEFEQDGEIWNGEFWTGE